MIRLVMLTIMIACACICSSFALGAEPVDFARDVQPIFENRCWKCHGSDKQQGGVRLDHHAAGLAAGDSGELAVSPGKPEKSELIRRIEAANVEERMPLNAEPLTPEQIKTLRDWISQGADWPETDVPKVAVRRQRE